MDEWSWIKICQERFQDNSEGVTVGIGDDAAVLPWNDSHELLVATDLLAEAVHFDLRYTSAYDLGFKAAAVNLSDIAAMGGKPTSFFLSLALSPRAQTDTFLEEFLKGLSAMAAPLKVPLLGGDTTAAQRDLFVNITVLGQVPKGKAKLRRMAKPGDWLCVTGTLGDSGTGLELLRSEEVKKGPDEQRLIEKHLRPQPHLEVAQQLMGLDGIHAMMDLSDGLASDLQRLMQAAQVGVELELDSLPLSHALQTICRAKKWDPLGLALEGGEDYCLLVTIHPDQKDKVIQNVSQAGFFLAPIGRITSSRELVLLQQGRVVQRKLRGFRHFG